MIDDLTEEFEEEILSEGKQVLDKVINDNNNKSDDQRWPTREQEKSDRLTHAHACQKVQQKVGHPEILGANQVHGRGTQKLGMTCSQKLTTRH